MVAPAISDDHKTAVKFTPSVDLINTAGVVTEPVILTAALKNVAVAVYAEKSDASPLSVVTTEATFATPVITGR